MHTCEAILSEGGLKQIVSIFFTVVWGEGGKEHDL